MSKNELFYECMIVFEIFFSNQKVSFQNSEPLVYVCRTIRSFNIINPENHSSPPEVLKTGSEKIVY